ncbi:NADP-dependent oxidoreductase [Capsulimonas corticalis]|uniref:NADP-dependent oxidoreductase n=1 Tax=Capsulimonas corticalis TaxID=2219043 RepID=A0A402D5F7_9BACT|nr:NADPH:quinone reductase [Capsulimonas corticalis]BDI29785.1 NADP-dependent oxidoreductase [Capsulimonas corticalis]
MKAIRFYDYGGPEVLKYEDAPDPTPGPGQVLIRTRAIGVNPFETYIRAGIYGPVPLPNILGVDAAGMVESVGEGVTEFTPGQRVYVIGAPGTYAELVLADHAKTFPLLETLTFSQGAAIGVPYGTAHRALFHRGKAQAGETVLIHGASGGVGTAAVQLARAAGLTVFGTAGTEKGLAMIRDEGAHQAFNHKDPDYLDKIKAETDGKGVDLILEMLANVNLPHDLELLAKYGRVAVVGSRGGVEINPRSTMPKETDIRGVTLMNATTDDLRAMHAEIGEGLKNGGLNPIIGQEIPLAEAARAHEAVMQDGAHGKIALIP